MRQHLRLSGFYPEREAEIIEEVDHFRRAVECSKAYAHGAVEMDSTSDGLLAQSETVVGFDCLNCSAFQEG